jgi:pyridoxal phosphate enzyme (YggS family)
MSAAIADNLAAVRRAIAHACRGAGRSADEVRLVCASKRVDAARIREAHVAGAREVGENYAQELRDKSAALADLGELRWHFIGALQRNKVRYVVGRVALIHSVDSVPLLEEIDRRAAAADLVQELLVELNLGGEASKSGVSEHALGELLDGCARLEHVRCVGLMTMPPFFDDPDRARPLFARLRGLLGEHAARPRPRVELRELSMGMSGDFETAIEEGATIVRVGTAIFGPRD